MQKGRREFVTIRKGDDDLRKKFDEIRAKATRQNKPSNHAMFTMKLKKEFEDVYEPVDFKKQSIKEQDRKSLPHISTIKPENMDLSQTNSMIDMFKTMKISKVIKENFKINLRPKRSV
mmetsp:Transcript_26380/g.30506  ORF Transcript_26380/g.30506 Transcript_26380/m.30506 type:complete len:118 (-) Transcript_26380:91-444(-)